MRSAPFGLVNRAGAAFAMAARGAQITHGHPTGYYAAGAFAAIVAYLVDGDSLEGSVLRALRELERHPGHEETSAALRQALDLAADGSPTRGEGRVPRRGLGRRGGPRHRRVLRTRHDRREGRAAPRPSTTPATATPPAPSAATSSAPCTATSDLPHTWVERVEGRSRIAALADDLAAEGVRG